MIIGMVNVIVIYIKNRWKATQFVKNFSRSFYIALETTDMREQEENGLMVYDWRFGQWRDIRMEAASRQRGKKSRTVSFERNEPFSFAATTRVHLKKIALRFS